MMKDGFSGHLTRLILRSLPGHVLIQGPLLTLEYLENSSLSLGQLNRVREHVNMNYTRDTIHRVLFSRDTDHPGNTDHPESAIIQPPSSSSSSSASKAETRPEVVTNEGIVEEAWEIELP
jgi:hypothetical protein